MKHLLIPLFCFSLLVSLNGQPTESTWTAVSSKTWFTSDIGFAGVHLISFQNQFGELKSILQYGASGIMTTASFKYELTIQDTIFYLTNAKCIDRPDTDLEHLEDLTFHFDRKSGKLRFEEGEFVQFLNKPTMYKWSPDTIPMKKVISGNLTPEDFK